MRNPDALLARLIDRITQLERIVSRQQMRINNILREAKVLEVDTQNGLAIVDAHGVVSKPIPWLQQAGDIVDWEPPAAGQRMVMLSPNGDVGRAFLLPGGFTEAVGQPYSDGAMFGRQIGGTKLSGSASGYMVETQTFTIKANVVIQGNVDISGGRLTHNGVNVGSSHTHPESIGTVTGGPG